MKGYLFLEDGTILEGKLFGKVEEAYGEIVFNTGMTGYQEILTDPSYAGQIVTMTYPLIGNYGINDDDFESDKCSVKGFVVKEYCENVSHWQSKYSLDEYLKKNNIVGISDIDTRMLTKKIRKNGSMKCLITNKEITNAKKQKLEKFEFPKDIVSKVSRKDILKISGGSLNIGIVDLGIKNGIVNQLENLGAKITIFPHNVGSDEILKGNFDAVLISNGPGDPKDIKEVIDMVKELIGNMPLFGICLGHQVLALALGADTYKLKFGHRGSNHPVINLQTNKVCISSQNHGYAVLEDSFTSSMKKTYININDNTIEGFE